VFSEEGFFRSPSPNLYRIATAFAKSVQDNEKAVAQWPGIAHRERCPSPSAVPEWCTDRLGLTRAEDTKKTGTEQHPVAGEAWNGGQSISLTTDVELQLGVDFPRSARRTLEVDAVQVLRSGHVWSTERPGRRAVTRSLERNATEIFPTRPGGAPMWLSKFQSSVFSRDLGHRIGVEGALVGAPRPASHETVVGGLWSLTIVRQVSRVVPCWEWSSSRASSAPAPRASPRPAAAPAAAASQRLHLEREAERGSRSEAVRTGATPVLPPVRKRKQEREKLPFGTIDARL